MSTIPDPPTPTVAMQMHCEICDKFFSRRVEYYPGLDTDRIEQKAWCDNCVKLILIADGYDESIPNNCSKCNEVNSRKMMNCDFCGARLPWAHALHEVRRMKAQTAEKMRQRQIRAQAEEDAKPKAVLCQSCNNTYYISMPAQQYYNATHDVNGQVIPFHGTCSECHSRIQRERRKAQTAATVNTVAGAYLLNRILNPRK